MSVGEGGGRVCCEQVSGKMLMLCWFLQVSVSGLGFGGWPLGNGAHWQLVS